MRFSAVAHRIALSLYLAFSGADVFAHAKTDVVTVGNGDHITGAINSMSAGKLAIDTDYAGTINVKWRQVQQITSRYLYEVRLDNGDRLYGRFEATEATEATEKLTLNISGTKRQFDIEDIVQIRTIEEELADKLDIKVSTTAYADPEVRTLVFSAASTYASRDGRTGFSARIDDHRTTSSDEQNTVKSSSNSTNVTLFREFWRERGKADAFRVLNAVYSSNDSLGVAHRASLGFGFGRYLMEDLGNELAVSIGLQGVQERRESCEAQGRSRTMDISTVAENGLATCNDAELFINLQWHLYSFQSRDMDIYFTSNAYPSLSDEGRLRGDMKLVLDWELFNNFFWSINARAELDNAGDQDDDSLDTTDFTLSTGITWKY